MKQNVNVECIMDFKEHPLIDLKFRYLSLKFTLKQVICSIVHSCAFVVQESSLYFMLASFRGSVRWSALQKTVSEKIGQNPEREIASLLFCFAFSYRTASLLIFFWSPFFVPTPRQIISCWS